MVPNFGWVDQLAWVSAARIPALRGLRMRMQVSGRHTRSCTLFPKRWTTTPVSSVTLSVGFIHRRYQLYTVSPSDGQPFLQASSIRLSSHCLWASSLGADTVRLRLYCVIHLQCSQPLCTDHAVEGAAMSQLLMKSEPLASDNDSMLVVITLWG